MRPQTETLFETDDSRTAQQKTFMIFGVNRGGTTAVAGVVRRLGIYLGDGLEGNLEDKLFRAKWGIDEIRKTISERNDAHDVWGWKHPHPHGYIDEIFPDLRNPRFIMVTRDMTANTIGMVSRDVKIYEKAIRLWMAQYQKNTALLWRAEVPTLFVSYEKLLIEPEQAVNEIAQFCHLDPDRNLKKHAVEFVVPGRYQTFEAQSPTIPSRISQLRASIKRRTGI